MTTFSANLKALREKAFGDGLSQAALCAKMDNFSQPLYSKYESGKTIPSPATAERLAKGLGVTVDDLKLPTVAERAPRQNHKPMKRRQRRAVLTKAVLAHGNSRAHSALGDYELRVADPAGRHVTIKTSRDFLSKVTLPNMFALLDAGV